MIKYWVLALLFAAIALRFVVRRIRDSRPVVDRVDLPLWESVDRSRGPSVDADSAVDTAPAVLSPPEEKRRAA